MAVTRLRTVTMIGYGSLILLFVAVAALVYANAGLVASRVQEVQRLHAVDRQVASLKLSISTMQRAARGQLLEARQTRADSFERAIRDYEAALAELHRTTLDPRQQILLGRITEQGRLSIDLLRAEFRLIAEGHLDQALSIFRTGRNDVLVESLSALVDEFLANDEQTLRERQMMMAQSLKWMGHLTWSGTLLAALMTIASGVWMVRRSNSIIGKATGEMISATSQIASSVEEHERVARD
ncbi:MAG: hypothetical protein HGA47_15495, partial [Zoogloea sp.]|nr:hypothetical protein [Zoogloea sp.]